MRNKQQVAEELCAYFNTLVIREMDPKLRDLLTELCTVMNAYNRGKPNIDDMRARAIAEGVPR